MKLKMMIIGPLSILGFGCQKPDPFWIRPMIEESVKECGGEIVNMTIVREGWLSNKFVGFVEVKIEDLEYQSDVEVYMDAENSFYRLDRNPCSMHELSMR